MVTSTSGASEYGPRILRQHFWRDLDFLRRRRRLRLVAYPRRLLIAPALVQNQIRHRTFAVFLEFDLGIHHLQEEHGLRFRKNRERLLPAQFLRELIAFQRDQHVHSRRQFIRPHTWRQRLRVHVIAFRSFWSFTASPCATAARFAAISEGPLPLTFASTTTVSLSSG